MNRFVRAAIFARVTWVGTAVLLLALFGTLHRLGWRDDTAILSGTSSPTGGRAMAIRGVLYALSYFSAVVVAPILLLGAGIDAMIRRILIR